ELAADLLDAMADHAAVGFELGLAGTSGADAAAQALEMLPLAHEARQEVGELGQLDLQLALHGARTLGEDVEDERGAVDDLEAERAAEVALLHGRERIVGDHEIGALTLRGRLELVHLALAEVELRRGRLALLGDPAHHFRARRFGEAAQLVERFLHLEAALPWQPEGGQKRPFSLPHSVRSSPSIAWTTRVAVRSACPLFLTRSAPPLRSRGRHAWRSGAPVLSSSLGPLLPFDRVMDDTRRGQERLSSLPHSVHPS